NGLAYNPQYGRVSGLTGIPTLLGWDNHERQWRGTTFDDANTYTDPTTGVKKTRPHAIETLYTSPTWDAALPLIKLFGITYVYVGPTERSQFGAQGGLAKFDQLKPICKSGDVSVYPTQALLTQTTVVAGQ
ncbi:MAG TPA: hypothetical protein VKQ72_14520, partial [Aggregatilineales bacterium]|nr:hypothetical protein [Aggregatilineales bacterium]